MRHKGSISQVNIDRDKCLRRLFREAMDTLLPATMRHICSTVADMPVPRFFISDEQAERYLRARLNLQHRRFRNPRKQVLYEALWDEYLRQYVRTPHAPFRTLVTRALAQPAPFVGLSTGYLLLCYPKICRTLRQGKGAGRAST